MKGLEAYEGLLVIFGISSVVLMLASVIGIPLVIAYLPKDYFVSTGKPWRKLDPLHLVGRCLKNLAGIIFLLAGLLMLFIPGQGILTLLLGLSLIDFPGKRRLELRLLRSSRIKKLVGWCRSKSGREPLDIPER